ncbi:MAG: hypothetical protein AAGA02_06640 [Bacteroidota bacterium]
MKNLILILLPVLFYSCFNIRQGELDTEIAITEPLKKTYCVENVCASNQFDGARLNKFKEVSPGHYEVTISPGNTPVNPSAWYVFQVWGYDIKTIKLTLAY